MRDRLIYQRQENIDLYTPDKLLIVGCGGIGTWLAILAAMSGVPELHLFDADCLEISNLNRLPYTTLDLGKRKTTALAEYIARIRPDCHLFTYGQASEVDLEVASNIGSHWQALVDCTDNIQTQRMTYAWATHSKHIPFWRAGYNGTSITRSTTVPAWTTEGGEDAGYTITPSWVVPAVTIAALTLAGIMSAVNQDINGDIADLKTMPPPLEVDFDEVEHENEEPTDREPEETEDENHERNEDDPHEDR